MIHAEQSRATHQAGVAQAAVGEVGAVRAVLGRGAAAQGGGEVGGGGAGVEGGAADLALGEVGERVADVHDGRSATTPISRFSRCSVQGWTERVEQAAARPGVRGGLMESWPFSGMCATGAPSAAAARTAVVA